MYINKEEIKSENNCVKYNCHRFSCISLIAFIKFILSVVEFIKKRKGENKQSLWHIFRRRMSRFKKKDVVSIYFGVPGTGKTTFAAYLTKRAVHKDIPVYSNVPITGAYKLEAHKDIGRYMIEDSLILIDEAGLEYCNRNFKDMSNDERYYYKYHRHYKTEVVFFSQSYNDMDITIRRLAQRYYVMSKSLFPFFITRREIGRRIGINEQTKEIIDEYYFKPFGRYYIFSPVLWKMFNSYSHKPLNFKEWEKW